MLVHVQSRVPWTVGLDAVTLGSTDIVVKIVWMV